MTCNVKPYLRSDTRQTPKHRISTMNAMNNSAGEKGFSVALDIGTTKVCVLIGRKDPYGKLEVIGQGRVESQGVLRGVVSNIEKTVAAIQDAMQKARRRSGLPVTKVHVGIAGQHIKAIQHRGILTRDNSHEEIGDKDIQALINDMYKLPLPPGEKIIHIFPQEFTVDNEQGIADPRGMSGVRLEANFVIVTGQITAIQNLRRCIERANLQVDDIVLEPVASAHAVLSEEEKEAGIVLVDIGGGTTDIAIFSEGILRHTAVIPFGGNAITRDIKEAANVMPDRAEDMKVRYGSAMEDEVDQNVILSISGLKGHEHKEISQKNLARIIRARVEEILDYVMAEIKRVGYQRKLTGGIVLTGGGGLLQHIDHLTAFHTGLTTRIGLPVDILANGYHADLASPVYSTALGLLIHGLEKPYLPEEDNQEIFNTTKAETDQPPVDSSGASPEPGKKRWLDRFLEKATEMFKEEADTSL